MSDIDLKNEYQVINSKHIANNFIILAHLAELTTEGAIKIFLLKNVTFKYNGF